MAAELLTSAYAVAREARLAQNRAALAELMPESAAATTTATATTMTETEKAVAAKVKRTKTRHEPTRKSSRLEDLKNPKPRDENEEEMVDDDDEEEEDQDVDYDMKLKISRLKELHENNNEAYSNPTATYEHTWMRVKTMGEKQLQGRVKAIERAKGQHCIVKMRMFAEVLALAGMDEVADEARQALDRLLLLVKKA